MGVSESRWDSSIHVAENKYNELQVVGNAGGEGVGGERGVKITPKYVSMAFSLYASGASMGAEVLWVQLNPLSAVPLIAIPFLHVAVLKLLLRSAPYSHQVLHVRPSWERDYVPPFLISIRLEVRFIVKGCISHGSALFITVSHWLK